MKILIFHQNFPGQFKSLAPALASLGHEVICIGDKNHIGSRTDWPPSIKVLPYDSPAGAGNSTHHYLQSTEAAIRRGQAVFKHLIAIKNSNFIPDICIGHTGWGESLYIKIAFPHTKVLGFFEFFYRNHGQDIGFDTEFKPTPDDYLKVPTKNAINYLALQSTDWCLTPTNWQAHTYPLEFREKMSVIFDGIDTKRIAPKGLKEISIGDLRLGADQKILTFVNRNLEPYRGFHIFMKLLGSLQKKIPDLIVVVVGGDEVSYGSRPPGGGGWRKYLLPQYESGLDMNRLHFTGRLQYHEYLDLLDIATVHLYLTYPFVQSWSMVEAMAMGKAVVGSDTSPVKEFITHQVNGLLVDFFDQDAIVKSIDELINNNVLRLKLGEAARKHIVDNYDLRTQILPKQIELVTELSRRKINLPGALII